MKIRHLEPLSIILFMLIVSFLVDLVLFDVEQQKVEKAKEAILIICLHLAYPQILLQLAVLNLIHVSFCSSLSGH